MPQFVVLAGQVMQDGNNRALLGVGWPSVHPHPFGLQSMLLAVVVSVALVALVVAISSAVASSPVPAPSVFH